MKICLYTAQSVEHYSGEGFISQMKKSNVHGIEELINNMEIDADVPCDVCRSPNPEEKNEMIFCDSCNVCVHQACYGVKTIPEGDWLCKPCTININPTCIFCPKQGGAMKCTSDGQKWAHVSCALWIKEVRFGNPELMEPIENISRIPDSRWNLECSLCKLKTGMCIQCVVNYCNAAFHVTCAFDKGLQIDMVEDPGADGVKLLSFCLTHTSLQKHEQNLGESMGSSRKRKRIQENLGSKENKIVTRLLRTKAPLEEENRASISHDTGIPVVSVAEETIAERGEAIQNEDDNSRIGVRLLTEHHIGNTVSKSTARKSFAYRPKEIRTLRQFLPWNNFPEKTDRNAKSLFSDKSKRVSIQKNPSNSKKSKFKQPSKKKKKQFSPHEEGTNTTPSEQPSTSHLGNEPQFSETPNKRAFSKSSDSAFDIRQLFPSPKKKTVFNDLPSTSNAQPYLPSSIQQTPTPGQNEQPLSDVAVSFQVSPTVNAIPKANFEDFSRYMSSLLKTLPFKKALRVQKKIISLVLKEHDLSSEEESDVSSLSSDE